jgi:hypothetical protein
VINYHNDVGSHHHFVYHAVPLVEVGFLYKLTCNWKLFVLYYQSFHCIQTMIVWYIDITINCVYFDIMEILKKVYCG